MRPLRPATDHRLGGPLPHQLANRPQPPPPATLAGLCSQRLVSPGRYAVLARVSPGYPPPKGRFATCYSPVRHFTHPDVLLHPDFLVRLACVRHAASVDSEPGSNSHLKSAPALDPRCRPKKAALDPRVVICEFLPRQAGEEIAQLVWNLKFKIPDLTWHAQLNCQRAVRFRRWADPQSWGGIDSTAPSLLIWLGSLLPTTLWGVSLAEQLLRLQANLPLVKPSFQKIL